MRNRLGCGCLAMILALANLLFAASIIYGMATGTSSVGVSLFSLAVFVGNIVLCLRTGATEIKAGRGKGASEADAGEDQGEEESEGDSQETASEEDD